MKRIILVSSLLAVTVMSVSAASISRTYNYFPVSGVTLAEIERELQAHGPRLDGRRGGHPGATRLEFSAKVEYAEAQRFCEVAGTRVSVEAEVILPRWRTRNRAESHVRLIWDTLERDIKRHEESHLVIAKNHARMLEDALKALPRRRNCGALASDVEQTTSKILAQHDAAQVRFDRIESINFESRMMRLLKYRLEQIKAGRISH
ncbi:DUF922 domain-containing Zn-dependent protease [Chelativorans sp. YIM 93263]|uniref:DUF922 domain-containing Zn-dependent protease n=1 Tax=Chelativorans sp. YIM 93263 TaxID=2906648 RepID=UPI002379B208|nr:DUF922 domain-containing protein [Chelativorans sp. YIM 93263]